ncbi:MAG TPA: sigma factor [Opitutaceae bacterium]|nr:sigma factor [Opitutaceae bacterium]
MSNDSTFPAPTAFRSAFPTTHWTVVLRAGEGSDTQARAALESLCSQYWYPLYAFVRRQGRTRHEAEDCTQEFFARLLAGSTVAHARPERGRFRTFLLAALRNFLTNEWHRARAEKRGGGQTLFSLDLESADKRFAHEPVDPGLTPEQAYDRSWAIGLIDAAIADLREEYSKSGRGVQFAALQPLVWGNPANESLAEPAARIGMNAHAFTVALYRLRRRFGERLRAVVVETVADAKDVDGELRHLIAAVSTHS